jgi:hypothetical protein
MEEIMKKITVLQITLAVTSLATIAYGQITGGATFLSRGVATWSVQTNTSTWNQGLGVKYTRQGCSEAPSNCLSFVSSVAQSDNVKVTLAIPLNWLTTAAYAREYSQLSLSAPYLGEVSIDDFVDQYRALFAGPFAQPAALVAQVIASLKSTNPNLRFGATIYEDELNNSYLQNAKLPAPVRAKFDYIHLFIHYREHGPNFSNYVQQAKQIFPNARIVAGSYAYDRRAYLPCAPSGSACTAQEDFNLFQQSLTIQSQEMNHGIVDHIEFYPGYFGDEAQWAGWNNPRECAPGDLAQCVSITVAMREAALTILKGTTSAAPSWTQLAPIGTLPSARYGHSAAMDSVNHRMIIFGGNSDTDALNDTWILTNADGKHGQPTWIQLLADNAPPAGSYSTGMYDPNSNRMVLYGGASGTDIWVLTNANGLGAGTASWIQLLPGNGALPSVLTSWEAEVYDPAHNVLIVYDSTAGVWVLSNANGLGGAPLWTQLNVSMGGPFACAGFTAVYSPNSNRMIVFGGSDGTTDFNDIWVLAHANGLDGTPEWIPLPTGTATQPAGREGHVAVYDPSADAMTIVGGIGQPADVWTAAHASGLTEPPAWTMVNAGDAALDSLTDCTGVLDANSRSMIIFGGYDAQILNSVFVLSPVM